MKTLLLLSALHGLSPLVVPPPTNRNVTTGTLSYTVNPTTGSDSTCNPCATLAGVAAVLPWHINHAVTITIPDGSYSAVGANFFGDWSQFSFGPSGVINIQSTSEWTRVATTTTYALSAGAAQGCTFASDPSFSANLYRGYMLRIVSGTGAGSTAVIRSHTTTAWTVAGGWNATQPDNTSVVEIVDPAAVLTFSDATATHFQWQGNTSKPVAAVSVTPVGNNNGNFYLKGIKFVSTNRTALDVNGLFINMSSGRFVNIEIDTDNSTTFLAQSATLSMDGSSNASSRGFQVRGGYIRLTGSVYIRAYGVGVNTTASTTLLPVALTLFTVAIDDCSSSGIALLSPFAHLSLGPTVNGTGNGTFGVTLLDGPHINLSSSGVDITGTSGDLQVDAVTVAWAVVTGATGTFYKGSKASWISSTTGVGPLYETVLSTTAGVDWNTTGKTTLYTVPSGKTAAFTKVVVRVPSTSLTTASCGFGRDASAADFAASATHTGLTGATLYQVISPIAAGAVLGAAADAFGTKCSIAQGGAATVTIDVFGYLY